METLKKKRTVLKSRLTSLIKKIESPGRKPANAYEVQLQDIWLKFCDVQEQMIDLADEENLEAIIEEYSLEETRFLEAKILLEEKSGSSSPGSTGSHSAEVRLPQLELPTFNGDVTEWASFADLFKAAVHNNPSLSDAQRLQYLKSSLRGEAASIIKHLLTTEENYVDAWELLRQRYENQRFIANKFAQRLIALPNIKEGHSLHDLLDQFNEADRALRAFLPKADMWEILMSNIITNHLDENSLRAWELSLSTTDVPPLKELLNFLQIRARAESVRQHHTSSVTAGKSHLSAAEGSRKCPECRESHLLRQCPKFERATTDARWEMIRKHRLCPNCAAFKHAPLDCKHGKCKKCKKHHHILLHRDKSSTDASLASTISSEVLLPTATLNLIDGEGKKHTVRALIDTGSQLNIIRSDLAKKFKLKTVKCGKSVSTVSGVHQLPQECSVTINKNSWQRTIRCYLAKDLNINIPSRVIQESWSHLDELRLADPEFKKPRPIELILGMGVASELFCDGIRRGDSTEPIAQNSRLGWLISGPTKTKGKTKIHAFTAEIQDTLRRFWELEEVPDSNLLTKEEEAAESHFNLTAVRTAEKQYEVQYPFSSDPASVGENKATAITRFLRLEKGLRRKGIKQQYAEVIREYLDLGHMIVATDDEEKSAFYLPHHAVFKESSTTHMRVVFDASAKGRNGKSLNDIMMNGPKTQEDLFYILLRFQTHAVALCADIEKMYRQIRVHPSHQKYQRIIWRDSESEPLRVFQLTTVTFGMKAAPYLATRTLLKLAEDEGNQFPMAKNVLTSDFYVDDLLTGAPSIESAKSLKKELTSLLHAGGFNLRKWCSNAIDVLKGNSQGSNDEVVTIADDESVKTLGLQWNPRKDVFTFTVNLPIRIRHSKRTLLSDTARIFDPLGWLSPVTIRAKMMFQSLWCHSMTWDQELPTELSSSWLQFRSDLPNLSKVQIKRYSAYEPPAFVTLCGFSDASQKAYGAVIYLRTELRGKITTKLLVAKSRVAPLKPTSIPRLELCAAVLLSRLLKETRRALKRDIPTILWTDSEIVLHWISQPAAKWKTFVANRVVEIQENAVNCTWQHVLSEDNPADLISRGVNPGELSSLTLWWNGPSWLSDPTIPIKKSPTLQSVPEERKTFTALTTIQNNHFMNKFSSLDRLLNVTAWIRRFIACAQRKSSMKEQHVTVQERRSSLMVLVRKAQEELFGEEIRALREKRPLNSHSSILNLDPFLDENMTLRVGGRLRNSDLTYARKHQILLPPKHHLTTLILRDLHLKNLHAGPQLLLNTLRSQFWIPRGRTVVRSHVQKCVTCAKQRACQRSQIMGNLPSYRTKPSRPFLKCGVDYCGPFICKEIAGRGRRTHKAFIAVFVCMVTKAVHLEVVSSLSLDAFLSAFNRFVARRGLPEDVYSDNGRNFTAAQKHLKDLYQIFQDGANVDKLTTSLAARNIQWHFIPPYTPHFGGLWEAAVKSLKFHLRRICGPSSYTFEELSTISARVEACLNSRPITPLSEDVQDIEALTPGHFLIGEPLNAIPEKNIQPSTPLTRLNRFHVTQKIVQDFWKRWKSDYLNSLQSRSKWKTRTGNDYSPGDLVVIKDPNSIPLMWKLGRVIDISRDTEGIIRVLSIQTSKGPTTRSINQIVKLPIEIPSKVEMPSQGTPLKTESTSSEMPVERNSCKVKATSSKTKMPIQGTSGEDESRSVQTNPNSNQLQ